MVNKGAKYLKLSILFIKESPRKFPVRRASIWVCKLMHSLQNLNTESVENPASPRLSDLAAPKERTALANALERSLA